MGARPSRRRPQGRPALDGDHRGGRRGGAGAILQPGDHRPVVRAGVHPAGPGGTAVRPAGFHQDLRHGGGRHPVGDPGPCADGLPDPWSHPGRVGQPDQPSADRRLPAGARLGNAQAQDHPGAGAVGLRHHGLAPQPAGRRVPAADGRRRLALHALGAAGGLSGQGLGPAAADRPHDPHGP